MKIQENSSLQRRLSAYSTLAVAGACAVAAVPHGAQAAIVYSGAQNVAIPPTSAGAYVNIATFATGTSYAAVNGGDATAPAINLWGTSASRAWLYPSNSTVNRFVSNASNLPLELSAGVTIDANSLYGTSTSPSALNPGGAWTASTTGYLGFRFLNGATTEYGWMQISVPAGGPTAADPIRFLGLAYENTGAAIAAGQTVIPEPGTVAALAVGAVGALAWRRRKAA